MAAQKTFPLSVIVRAVDKLTGPLRAMTAKLNAITAPVKKIGKDLSKFSEAVGFPTLMKGFQGFGGALKNVGSEAFGLGARLFAMAGVAGFALFSIVRGAVDAGDKLAELSDRAKVSADWFASMQYAAAQADVEQEDFNGAIDHFVKGLGDMKAGGGQLLSFLNKVSPKLAEQVKGAKSTEAAFALMTDAFVRIEDPSKRAALSAAAFGRTSIQLGNFMHQGSNAIQKQQLEYLRLAGSQEAFARGGSDLDNALRDTETAFLGLRSAAFGALFPAFTALSKVITEFLVKNRDGIQRWAQQAAAAISAWVQSGGVERLIESISNLATSIVGFLDSVGGFKTVAIAIAAVLSGPLLLSIATLVPAIYGLGVALLTTPVGWFLLAVGAIAFAAYEIYKHWEPIKKFFSDLWGELVREAKVAWEFLKPIVEAIAHPFGTSEDSEAGAPSREERQAMYNRLHPALAAPLGAAAVARGATQSTEANVRVEFSNTPPGTRVTQDKTSTQPVDLSTGFAMSSP